MANINYATFNNYSISGSGLFFYADVASSSGDQQTLAPSMDLGAIYAGASIVFQSTSVPGQVIASADGEKLYTLTQTGYQSNGQISFHDESGLLTLLSNTPLNQQPDGSWPNATVANDGSDGTFNVSLACFAKGTLIRTPNGERAIETLAEGDLVLTAAGEEKAVRWVGHRSLRFSDISHDLDALPVRISADAFGPGLPFADLLVSPGHAMAFDMLGTVLVPAKSLINGSTIRQVAVEGVTYYHVELEEHDVIVANGVGAESFINVGNRSFFANMAAVDLMAKPDDASRTLVDYCAPFHAEGVIVDAIRAQIQYHAEAKGWVLARDLWAGIRLDVDGAIVTPHIRDTVAKFLVPADARSIRILSDANIPAFVGINGDRRMLGVCIEKMTLSDGFSGERDIAMSDARLSEGFHDFEHEEGQRWTNGNANLPAALFEGMDGTVMLTIRATGGLSAWTYAASDLGARTSVAA